MSESDFGRMKQYDQFKPYLVSKALRFSYPAFSNEQVRWQQAMTRLDMPTLASRLAAQNFSAVLVDRYGYEDQGAAVIAGLRRSRRRRSRDRQHGSLRCGGHQSDGGARRRPRCRWSLSR